MVLRIDLHDYIGDRRHARLCDRRVALQFRRRLRIIQLYGYGEKRSTTARLCRIRRLDHPAEGVHANSLGLVTITSGFAAYSLPLFILFSAITRGARFYVLAFLLNRYGPSARAIIEERLGFWTAIGAVGLIGGFIVAFMIF